MRQRSQLTHYPPTVSEVVAVEPEAYLRALAQTAAASSSPPIVRVIDGLAEALPVPDATFDAAVVSLMLCSVGDPTLALTEIHRVLRPGGELRFYEHVRAASGPLCRLQRLASPLWQTIAGGCRPDRDTPATIESAGFDIERIDRFDYRPGPLVPLGLVTPHVLGVARASQQLADVALRAPASGSTDGFRAMVPAQEANPIDLSQSDDAGDHRNLHGDPPGAREGGGDAPGQADARGAVTPAP